MLGVVTRHLWPSWPEWYRWKPSEKLELALPDNSNKKPLPALRVSGGHVENSNFYHHLTAPSHTHTRHSCTHSHCTFIWSFGGPSPLTAEPGPVEGPQESRLAGTLRLSLVCRRPTRGSQKSSRGLPGRHRARLGLRSYCLLTPPPALHPVAATELRHLTPLARMPPAAPPRPAQATGRPQKCVLHLEARVVSLKSTPDPAFPSLQLCSHPLPLPLP